MRTIELTTRVMQAQGIMVSDMDGEKVMMSVRNGKYYNLGQTGGRIWELISAPVTVRQVIDSLLEEYEVSRPECEQQVLAFLSNLHNEQLIEVVESAEDGYAANL
jgi:hypothetical protein